MPFRYPFVIDDDRERRATARSTRAGLWGEDERRETTRKTLPLKKRKNYTFTVCSLPGTSHRKRVRESPFRARARGGGASSSALSSPPALVEDHGFFDYELPLLVLLALLVRKIVLPTQQRAA